jgi:hypothetical protein
LVCRIKVKINVPGFAKSATALHPIASAAAAMGYRPRQAVHTIVFLRSDPSVSISNVADVYAVIEDGQFHMANELREAVQ